MNGTKYANGTIEQMENGRWRTSTVDAQGRQIRRRFARKVDAERFLESVRDNRPALTPADVADAQAALELLRKAGNGWSLTHVVSAWLSRPQECKRGLKAAVEEYMADIAGSVGEYADKRYGQVLRQFVKETGEETAVAEVTEKTVKEYLARHTSKPEGFKTYRRTLNTFWAWAMKRKYTAENPVDTIRTPRTVDTEVDYYTAEEARKIIAKAAEVDPAMVPYFVLGFFAGLRPVERNRLNVAKNVAVDPDHPDARWYALNITGDVAKGSGHARRFVELDHTARQMLMAWESEFGTLTGSIVPCGSVKATAKRASAIAKAAVGRSLQDGERHTFATYKFAATKDSALTAQICGHSESVALKHYRGRISHEAGLEYFRVNPEDAGLRTYAGLGGLLQDDSPRPLKNAPAGWVAERWDGGME